jgi:hypothetical protein
LGSRLSDQQKINTNNGSLAGPFLSVSDCG